MPNQKAIAQELGISQSTVSRALRNDHQIPEATRKKVREMADRLAYRPNPMVSSLMEQIRSGRSPQAHGCLMIIVDRKDKKDWFRFKSYKEQYDGFTHQAAHHGYTTDCLFLRGKGAQSSNFDDILYRRGIDGVFLAAPNWQESGHFELSWERYATGTIGYSWERFPIDRVSTAHRRNANRCYRELTKRGYRRIGMVLDVIATNWADQTWMAASALHQTTTAPEEAIPNFVINQPLSQKKNFKDWLTKWKPTAVVCVGEGESKWMDRNGWLPNSIPRVLCNRPSDSAYAGMDENNHAVGAALCDLIVAKITQNQRGPASDPKTILIEGKWCDSTLLPSIAPEEVIELQNRWIKGPE